MASDSKNNQNKPEKMGSKRKLELSDCTCPICLYILIEPVTLPCGHEFCMNCFDTNVKETSLLCPMCRMRIASWARRAARNNKLINETRWKAIQLAFPKKVECRLQGIEGGSSSESEQDFVINHLSEEGEIRKEYEDEMKRLREERERQCREEEEASERLIAALQAEEFTRQLEQERQTLSDEAMARELTERETTPLRLSSTSAQKLSKKTPTLMEKFVRKRPGDETNRNNNSVTNVSGKTAPKADEEPYPYPCYSPRDYGKIITSQDATMDHYPYVDLETFRKKRLKSAEGSDHGNKEDQKKGKTEEETLLDFIFIDSREPTPMSPKQQEMEVKSERGVQTSSLRSSITGNAKSTGSERNVEIEKSNKSTLKDWLTPNKGFKMNSKDSQFKDPVSSGAAASCAASTSCSTRRESEEESSVGNDSIGPELRHFRPVKTYPKTSPERLPGGGLVKPPLVRSLPVSLKVKETSPLPVENLNPAKLGSSPVIQRHLQVLQAERQLQVKLQSKATSTSVVSLPTTPKSAQRKIDLYKKASPSNSLKETITMETAAFLMTSPRCMMKTSKYPEVTSSDFRTSTQKSSADEPDSTVVIGDSDSGSSDVQLIGEVPAPYGVQVDKPHTSEPLLPILPLDHHLHDNQYPQLYSEDEDDEYSLSKAVETIAKKSEKSETTTSSILALMDTGQATKESASHPELINTQLVSETTRSDAANLSLLGAYKEGDHTGSSLFGVGVKGDENLLVANREGEPRLTSFSNIITPIKCRRDSPENLHLDNFTCAQIREESLDKLDGKSEQGSNISTSAKGVLNLVVPSEDSAPVSSSNIQSSPRSKVYRMKRCFKSHSKASGNAVINIDLTKSPSKTARSSEGQRMSEDQRSRSGEKKVLNKAELLKRDLDVPVMSPEVGVQEWLQNHTYMPGNQDGHQQKPCHKVKGQEEGPVKEIAETRDIKGKQVGQGVKGHEDECISTTGKGSSVSGVSDTICEKSKSGINNVEENDGSKLLECEPRRPIFQKDVRSADYQKKLRSGSIEMENEFLQSSFHEATSSGLIDHSYSKSNNLAPVNAPCERDAEFSCGEKRDDESLIEEEDVVSKDDSILKKIPSQMMVQSSISQTLSRTNTGGFTVRGSQDNTLEKGMSHGYNTGKVFPEVIKSVCDNTVTVVGASNVLGVLHCNLENISDENVATESCRQFNTGGKQRTLINENTADTGMAIDCSPAKKLKLSDGTKIHRQKKMVVANSRSSTCHDNNNVQGFSCSLPLQDNNKVVKVTDNLKGSIGESQHVNCDEVCKTCDSSQLSHEHDSAFLTSGPRTVCECFHKGSGDDLDRVCICDIGERRQLKNTQESSLLPSRLQTKKSIELAISEGEPSKEMKNLESIMKASSGIMANDMKGNCTTIKVKKGTGVKVTNCNKVKGQPADLCVENVHDLRNDLAEQTPLNDSAGERLSRKPPIYRGKKRKGDHGSLTGSEGSVGNLGKKRGRPCKKISQSPAKAISESELPSAIKNPQNDRMCEKSDDESDIETESISSRTRSKTPTKSQNVTPVKKLFNATPCKEMVVCTSKRKRTPGKSCGLKSCDHELIEDAGRIVTRTRRTGATPSKEIQEGVTPGKERHDVVTPAKKIPNTLTPSKEFQQGVTHSKVKHAGITPSKKIEKGVTQSNKKAKGFTPSKNVQRGISVGKKTAKGVTPSKQNAQGVTINEKNVQRDMPSKDIKSISSRTRSSGVTPSKEIQLGVTPGKRKHKGITPNKDPQNIATRTGVTPSKENAVGLQSSKLDKKVTSSVSKRTTALTEGNRGRKLSSVTSQKQTSGEASGDIGCDSALGEASSSLTEMQKLSDADQEMLIKPKKQGKKGLKSSSEKSVVQKKHKRQRLSSETLFSGSENEDNDKLQGGGRAENKGVKKTVAPCGNKARTPGGEKTQKGRPRKVNNSSRKSEQKDVQVRGKLRSVEYTPTADGKKKKMVDKKHQKQGGNKTKGDVKDSKKTTQTTLVFVGQDSEDEFEENVKKVKKVLTFSKKNQVEGNVKKVEEVSASGERNKRCGGGSDGEVFNQNEKPAGNSVRIKEARSTKVDKLNSERVFVDASKGNTKTSGRRTQSEIITNTTTSMKKNLSTTDNYSKLNCPWYGLDSPRKCAASFRTVVKYKSYVEEQDRLLALKLQADFDMEAKFQLTAIRRKGSIDEYKLRAKQRRQSAKR